MALVEFFLSAIWHERIKEERERQKKLMNARCVFLFWILNFTILSLLNSQISIIFALLLPPFSIHLFERRAFICIFCSSAIFLFIVSRAICLRASIENINVELEEL